jgi:RND family efflux transporter MFP subunit
MVMRTDRMRVVVPVPNLDVPLLNVGDKATVVVDALKAESFQGAVARLARAEDPMTRTIRAEVDLPNPTGRLVEGLYGRVTIELQPPSGDITVPAACIIGHTGRGTGTLFVVRDGRARRLSITLGEGDGSRVEVLSGLGPDDEVVLRPGGSLRVGSPVGSTSVNANTFVR